MTFTVFVGRETNQPIINQTKKNRQTYFFSWDFHGKIDKYRIPKESPTRQNTHIKM
jgi:hypothetical protein